MVIALAVIALPTLMKFFSFLGFQVTGGTGALAAAAGMIGSGALLASSLGGGGGGRQRPGVSGQLRSGEQPWRAGGVRPFAG